jgi:hypothetical protein
MVRIAAIVEKYRSTAGVLLAITATIVFVLAW